MPSQQTFNDELSASTPKKLSPSQWVNRLTLLYFFSGVTALAFEVLWARMLALQFGVSIFGVVLTVVAFMLGLGAGSLWGGRLCGKVRNPLRMFAILEIGIAIYALAIPSLQQYLDTLLYVTGGSLSLTSWYAVQCVAAFFLLALPALAMGLNFPLVLATLPTSSLSKVYGFNAVGGALGALLPLLLLPLLGWSTSVSVIAVLALIVGVAAMGLARSLGEKVAWDADMAPSKPGGLKYSWLIAYSGIGAAALMLQVAWTRLFGMIFLRTEYVLAVLLAAFLLGIGLGSLAARHMKDRVWFAWLPVLAASFSLLSLWSLPLLGKWAETTEFGSLSGALFAQGLMIALVTFPVTLALGAWLPFLTRSTHELAPGSGAKLYGVNSLGAAVGAMLSGFVLIPWIGTAATLCIAALLLFLCGMTFVRARWPWGVAVLLAAGVWLGSLFEMPAVARLLPVTQAHSHDLYAHEDAVAITQVVEQDDGQRLLLTDLQRMDASSDPAAVIAQQNQSRLPLLLHPAPRSVLFLGLGTGISAAGSLAFPDLKRSAVELSQGAITSAGSWFAPVNANAMQHIVVTRDDARRFLRNSTGHYDVIIGDLFHPDLAGHSALLSVQQFERARARLSSDGLFVQWLALNQFDARSMNVILRSFAHVFPNAALFVDGFRLALVGPKDSLQGAPAMLANLKRMSTEQRSAATGEEGPWTWLGRYFGQVPSTRGLMQDEWAPQIEFSLPRARYSNDWDLGELLSGLLQQRPDLRRAAAELHIPDEAIPDFERGYVGSFLAVRSWIAAIKGDEVESQRLIRIAYEANHLDRWVSAVLADKMYATLPQALAQGMDKRRALTEILRVNREHTDALRAFWHLEQEAGNERAAKTYFDRLGVASPLDRAVQKERTME